MGGLDATSGGSLLTAGYSPTPKFLSGAHYCKMKAALSVISDPEWRAFLSEGIDKAGDTGDFHQMRHGLALRQYPVHIERFLFDQKFLARPKDVLYPGVLDSLIEISEDHGRLLNTLTEMVGTGGIGSGKSTLALYVLCYQLYLFSCYSSPHSVFNLDPTSEILFAFQSLTAGHAKALDFERFKAICRGSPYFTREFPFDKELESQLVFPNRLIVKPMTSDMASIGFNLAAMFIDEVNSFPVIEQSKKAQGGTYDGIWAVYNSVSRRFKSRFMSQGGTPGIICLVSSKMRPGEFTDKKVEEAKTDPTIYIFDKRVYDVKPKGTFKEQRFQVFSGDLQRKARILPEGAYIPAGDEHLIVSVPEDFRKDFEKDIIGALRDIAGVGTLARFPFFANADLVSACFGKVPSIFNKLEHDFSPGSLALEFYPDAFKDLRFKRFVHLDLGITHDAAGIACGYCPGFKTEVVNGQELQAPIIRFDFTLRVTPPRGGEIDLAKLRGLVLALRDAGLPIKVVTLDSYQSVDTVQQLRSRAFTTGLYSTDKTAAPYEVAKAAFYDGRVELPTDDHALKEILSLEMDSKGHIDHPKDFSKDVADAIACVIYAITLSRSTYAEHNIPVMRVPTAVRIAQRAEDGRKAAPVQLV
jgi:hypothetical protein